MRPSRPPRWLVQIPRLSGGLCFLARKSSLASNDPSHGTLMPTRTLSWGSSILIKGGKTPPPWDCSPSAKGRPFPGTQWTKQTLLGRAGSPRPLCLPPEGPPVILRAQSCPQNGHSHGLQISIQMALTRGLFPPLGLFSRGVPPPAGRPRPGSLSEWTAPSRAEGFSPATWCPPQWNPLRPERVPQRAPIGVFLEGESKFM